LQFHCGKPPPAADPTIFTRIAKIPFLRGLGQTVPEVLQLGARPD